ncbi:unnamed protein product [Leuciscus chuanchicus]
MGHLTRLPLTGLRPGPLSGACVLPPPPPLHCCGQSPAPLQLHPPVRPVPPPLPPVCGIAIFLRCWSATLRDEPRLPTSTVTVTPDRSVFTGETVNLKCVIKSDHSNWRYEWYKDSVILQTSDRYTVNRDTLTIRGATESDQGQYWCKGQRDGRPNSSTSSSRYLSVKDKPILTVKPQSSVFTGDTVTLSCDVGSSTRWTFHWRKDSNSESSDDAGTKTISSVRVSDGGTYECRAQRGEYYTHFSDAIQITVRVRPKPVVVVQPDVRVFRGERVTLTCDIQETGVWSERKEKLDESDEEKIVKAKY